MSRDRDALQSLWTDQPEEEDFVMSVEEIRSRAERFQTRITRRNLIEYAATILVVAVFAVQAALVPELVVRIGALLVVLGAMTVAWRLHVQGRAATRAEMDQVGSSWAEFHRAELVRQRDALRSVWAWYIGPFVPGSVVFMLGVGTAPSTGLPLVVGLVSAVLGLVFAGAVFAFIARLNAWAADRLQAEIDALDAARRG
jgi:purine-cytosine permease-like protein